MSTNEPAIIGITITSMQSLPLAVLLAMPTLSGLWSQNCLEEDMLYWVKCLAVEHLSGGHVLLVHSYIYLPISLCKCPSII